MVLNYQRTKDNTCLWNFVFTNLKKLKHYGKRSNKLTLVKLVISDVT